MRVRAARSHGASRRLPIIRCPHNVEWEVGSRLRCAWCDEEGHELPPGRRPGLPEGVPGMTPAALEWELEWEGGPSRP